MNYNGYMDIDELYDLINVEPTAILHYTDDDINDMTFTGYKIATKTILNMIINNSKELVEIIIHGRNITITINNIKIIKENYYNLKNFNAFLRTGYTSGIIIKNVIKKYKKEKKLWNKKINFILYQTIFDANIRQNIMSFL